MIYMLHLGFWPKDTVQTRVLILICLGKKQLDKSKLLHSVTLPCYWKVWPFKSLKGSFLLINKHCTICKGFFLHPFELFPFWLFHLPVFFRVLFLWVYFTIPFISPSSSGSRECILGLRKQLYLSTVRGLECSATSQSTVGCGGLLRGYWTNWQVNKPLGNFWSASLKRLKVGGKEKRPREQA